MTKGDGGDRVAGASVPLHDGADDASCLDLTNLDWADPLFIVRARAWLEVRQRHGDRVRLMRPRNGDVANYLARMRLDHDLADGASDLPAVREHDRRKALVPLSRPAGLEACDRLTEELTSLLDSQFGDELGPVVEPFGHALSEMANNAVEHGRAGGPAFIAAQRYRRRAGACLVLAIGDLGVGIPGHLRAAGVGDGDDATVLARAIQLGVTGSSESHRGQGFDWTRDQLREGSLPRAALHVWSGAARHRYEVAGDRIRVDATGSAPPTWGAWIRVELWTGS